MALGRQGERQTDLVVGWAELPRSPGHVFYDRLQTVLTQAGFDGFAEQRCAPYYASGGAARRCRRAVTSACIWSATSRGSIASVGWNGAAPTACPCASSCGWARPSRCPTIPG